MKSKTLLYIALGVAGVAVIGGQAAFFGAEELIYEQEERDRKIEAGKRKKTDQLVSGSRAACISEGHAEEDCDCMVKEIRKLLNGDNIASGASGAKKLKTLSNRGRDRCSLPPQI